MVKLITGWMNTRIPLAVLLWLGTVAVIVITLAVSNDSCDAPDWIVWALIGVGLAAAGATFMSLRTRFSVALAIGLFVGLVVGLAFWFLVVALWVGRCTA
jgi:hypothetical protein